MTYTEMMKTQNTEVLFYQLNNQMPFAIIFVTRMFTTNKNSV